MKNHKNYYGHDSVFFNDWYARIMEDGKQLWARVRDKKIVSGGIHDIPKDWHSEWGFCNPPMQKR